MLFYVVVVLLFFCFLALHAQLAHTWLVDVILGMEHIKRCLAYSPGHHGKGTPSKTDNSFLVISPAGRNQDDSA